MILSPRILLTYAYLIAISLNYGKDKRYDFFTLSLRYFVIIIMNSTSLFVFVLKSSFLFSRTTKKKKKQGKNYYYFLFLRIDNIRACLMFFENVLIL